MMNKMKIKVAKNDYNKIFSIYYTFTLDNIFRSIVKIIKLNNSLFI